MNFAIARLIKLSENTTRMIQRHAFRIVYNVYVSVHVCLCCCYRSIKLHKLESCQWHVCMHLYHFAWRLCEHIIQCVYTCVWIVLSIFTGRIANAKIYWRGFRRRKFGSFIALGERWRIVFILFICLVEEIFGVSISEILQHVGSHVSSQNYFCRNETALSLKLHELIWRLIS